ncbi:hypothetical protein [Parasphingorhabdus halotolerans]|uniref:Uncharacterized protein n=1 Tax=Parasphingorhabdus halotolerans TaxID=2725558 RepID=A0A6H2DMK3_9SPHN|nr:hypothetical protein [Parasphingorhabdus halotolerans]QJB69418.1 hypothetical protein HF685_09095 [Parasphingorhabdus halotolerans]
MQRTGKSLYAPFRMRLASGFAVILFILEASYRKINKPKVLPHWLSIIELKEQA